MNVRIATEEDLDGVTATLTAAFESDPLWGWAFPEPQGLEAWWHFLTTSALRYPWTWVADDYAAVSVWIPPGGVELTVEEEARIDHRGKGLGMALLADNLTRIDAEAMPAYLESSNAANDPRYERQGFSRVGSFTRPDEQVSVSTMWRDGHFSS